MKKIMNFLFLMQILNLYFSLTLSSNSKSLSLMQTSDKIIDIKQYIGQPISIRLFIKNINSNIFIVPDIDSCSNSGKSIGYCGYAFASVYPYVPVKFRLLNIVNNGSNYYCFQVLGYENIYLAIQDIEGKNCDVDNDYCKLIKLVRLDSTTDCSHSSFDAKFNIANTDEGTFGIISSNYPNAYLQLDEIPQKDFPVRNSLIIATHLAPPILGSGKPYLFYMFQTCNYRYSTFCFNKLDFTKLSTANSPTNQVYLLIQTEYYLNEKYRAAVPFINLVQAGSSMGLSGKYVINSDSYSSLPDYKFDIGKSLIKAQYSYNSPTQDFQFVGFWNSDNSPVIFNSAAAHTESGCDGYLNQVYIRTCRYDNSLFEIVSFCPEAPLYFQDTWSQLRGASTSINSITICFNVWFAN